MAPISSAILYARAANTTALECAKSLFVAALLKQDIPDAQQRSGGIGLAAERIVDRQASPVGLQRLFVAALDKEYTDLFTLQEASFTAGCSIDITIGHVK
jgi:hypothetical protein